MTAIVLRGDARQLPLPDESVDVIVTSPPYYGLRSYTDGGEHYDGQIGSEESPQEYIEALLECTREWMRVLKPTGSMFVNLGDKYADDTKWGGASGLKRHPGDKSGEAYRKRRSTGFPRKTLMGLPWRYAIGCIDELGLILRQEQIWSKPNGLPESVQDRCRRAHEQWFHLVREPRYFAAVDEIREPYAPGSIERSKQGFRAKEGYDDARRTVGLSLRYDGNPLGKLPGTVWTIPTEPLFVPRELEVDHFAAFPTEWPRRLVNGWCPVGYCSSCGRPLTLTTERELVVDHIQARRRGFQDLGDLGARGNHGAGEGKVNGSYAVRRTGYTCACFGPHPLGHVTPAVVLDPFGGTGTTALVASVLGRIGVTVDRSADYCRLAQWRCNDPKQRAKAMRLPAPRPEADGQQELFGGMMT